MELDKCTFIFDIDGTICPIKKKEEKYEDLVPFESIVKKITEYHNQEQKLFYLHLEI